MHTSDEQGEFTCPDVIYPESSQLSLIKYTTLRSVWEYFDEQTIRLSMGI